jgi:CheY-like chemotaxis protein
MTRPTVLVVDDHEAVRDALAEDLRGAFEVLTTGTVGGALDALKRNASIACVVLDLLLDVPAAPLHRELVACGKPVVVVSGLESEAANTIARVYGWQCLAKPVAHETLNRAVQTALENHVTTPQESPRVTLVPTGDDAPAPDTLPAPPNTPTEPTSGSGAPLAGVHPAVAIVDMITRRVVRLASAAIIAWLIYHGDTSGHPLSGVAVASLSALGMGAEAFAAAVRKRPGATAAGVAGLVTLALAGSATQTQELGSLAAFGVVGATALVDRARTT